jgi:hypothetical protein
LKYQEGFALPYVLMAVTLLGLLASSVIMLQHVRRMIAVKEIALTKARYAAESIVAEFASDGIRAREYPDGSKAWIDLYPWGLFDLVVARGNMGKAAAKQTAVLASMPDSAFRRAVCFGNLEHDLILAGTVHIKGDLSLRRGGASVGTLADYPTPRFLPVLGKVRLEPKMQFPLPSQEALNRTVRSLESILGGSIEMSTGILKTSSSTQLLDTARWLGVTGSLVLGNEVRTGSYPLYIAVDGEVVISSGARLSGPVAILASGKITVAQGARLASSLLYSRREILFANREGSSCQLVAPKVQIKTGSQLEYPSTVVALPIASGRSCEIRIEGASRVDGFVGVFSSDPQPDRGLLTIEPKASVRGAAYSDGCMTMDGDVTGTVLAMDFQFVHPPTTYNGWLRTGMIDRPHRPGGFLLPVPLGDGKRLAVLEWL